ncbi:MAG: hypothetical protein ACR2RE_14335, partial [Geminicoccaceae bacterium]
DKLVMEAWVDLLKADDVGDTAVDLIEALEKGEGVDVSVGAFIDSVARPGTHQGKVFARTQTGYVPDHVALLPGQTGACSWEDGCGAPRVNQAIKDNTMTLQMTKGQGEPPLKSNCSCGGKDGDCTCDDGPMEHSITGVLQFKAHAIGDQARRRIIAMALNEKLGQDMFFMIVEVFDDTVIYEARGGVFSREYTINEEDGTVTLSDDPVQGALVAEFMPITVQQEEPMNEREKAVNGLIANEAAPWSDDDRQFLMDMADDKFAKLTTEPKAAEAGGGKGEAFPKVEIEPAANAGDAPQSAEQYLAAAPAEVREILTDGMAERGRARADLIGKIKANESNQFTDEELQAMGSNQLRKLAALSFADANAGRPAAANYAGAQPAASAGTEIKHFADQPGEPDWTKRAH